MKPQPLHPSATQPRHSLQRGSLDFESLLQEQLKPTPSLTKAISPKQPNLALLAQLATGLS